MKVIFHNSIIRKIAWTQGRELNRDLRGDSAVVGSYGNRRESAQKRMCLEGGVDHPGTLTQIQSLSFVVFIKHSLSSHSNLFLFHFCPLVLLFLPPKAIQGSAFSTQGLKYKHQGLLFFFLSFISYWSTVDLQCCVSFRCTAKGFGYTYTYICSFQILFPYGLLQNIEQSPLCYTVGLY